MTSQEQEYPCKGSPPHLIEKDNKESFWKAVSIYVQKPHVINRKICGFQLKKLFTISSPLNMDAFTDKSKSILVDEQTSNLDKNIDELIDAFPDVKFTEIKDANQETLRKIFSSTSTHGYLVIRNVIPKSLDGDQNSLEFVLLDKLNDCVFFIPKLTKGKLKVLPELTYSIYSSSRDTINLKIMDGDETTSCAQWLKRFLCPRLQKWANQEDQFALNLSSESLQLIDIQDYNKLYQELKAKYAQNLIKMWTESTDPHKFVHEDIGIAAYLLLLWKEERAAKNLDGNQTFLDMGCGNGLLVCILTMEGHTGVGIDVKKRKIWQSYPDNVILKEEPIVPSCNQLYPEYDWLIGNHSDELTPWIPVIASKSSWKSRFFILPCCAHDFYFKFRRVKSTISQYNEYLDYVQEIAKVCGFKVKRDRLRIPSTKRVCFIGQERSHTIDERNLIFERISQFIEKRKDSSHHSSPKALQFKVREKDQAVKNCTYIKPEVKLELVNTVASLLLRETCSLMIPSGKDTLLWNKGGQMSLKVVAGSFTSLQLQHLKKECGGLQTLLKNHRNIFLVKNGSVQLRVPLPSSKLTISKELLRSKPCWFFTNHPNGCPLSKLDCAYSHSVR